MKSKLFFFTLIIIFIFACSRDAEEVVQIKGTIMRYNQLLIEGYKNLNMNPLQEVATTEHATELYYHMAALGEADIKMLSTLKKIDFTRVNIVKSDKVVVSTREVWDFVHVDIKTDERVYDEKDFVYEMRYELIKKDGRWLVEKVTAVSAQSSSPVEKKHPQLDQPPKMRKDKGIGH